jgi:hypothetical protein
MTFPSLHLYALDTLTILAMSAECERDLSQCQEADLLRKRNRLAEDIIEVSECLKE